MCLIYLQLPQNIQQTWQVMDVIWKPVAAYLLYNEWSSRYVVNIYSTQMQKTWYRVVTYKMCVKCVRAIVHVCRLKWNNIPIYAFEWHFIIYVGTGMKHDYICVINVLGKNRSVVWCGIHILYLHRKPDILAFHSPVKLQSDTDLTIHYHYDEQGSTTCIIYLSVVMVKRTDMY